MTEPILPIIGRWEHAGDLIHRNYTCGHCGRESGSRIGYKSVPDTKAYVYICGACNRPIFFRSGTQVPRPLLGASVLHLPTGGVAELYEEVRTAASAGAFTAAVTVARTLVAHVAVNKGAESGKSFQHYVEWLETAGYTTAPMKPWVDHIRQQANVSAHELKLMNKDEGTRSLAFVELLLRIVYEYPGAVPPTAPGE